MPVSRVAFAPASFRTARITSWNSAKSAYVRMGVTTSARRWDATDVSEASWTTFQMRPRESVTSQGS